MAGAPEQAVQALYAWSRQLGLSLVFCHSARDAIRTARQHPALVLVAVGSRSDAEASGVFQAIGSLQPPPPVLDLASADGRPLAARAIAAALTEIGVRAEGRPEVLQFATVHLDLVRHQLRVDGALRPLSRKRFDLLAYLALNAGRNVSSDELHLHVVGKIKGDPYRISKDVKAVRYALGRAWRMIKTGKKGEGYQFQPDAELDAEGAGPPPGSSPPGNLKFDMKGKEDAVE